MIDFAGAAGLRLFEFQAALGGVCPRQLFQLEYHLHGKEYCHATHDGISYKLKVTLPNSLGETA